MLGTSGWLRPKATSFVSGSRLRPRPTVPASCAVREFHRRSLPFKFSAELSRFGDSRGSREMGTPPRRISVS